MLAEFQTPGLSEEVGSATGQVPDMVISVSNTERLAQNENIKAGYLCQEQKPQHKDTSCNATAADDSIMDFRSGIKHSPKASDFEGLVEQDINVNRSDDSEGQQINHGGLQ